MEKNITLSNNHLGVANKTKMQPSKSVVDMITESNFIVALAELFSAVMEEEVTPRQTLLIINVIIASMLLIFCPVMPVMVRIINFAWVAVALLQCKREGMGE